jgi:hypothetical protein
MRKAFPNPASFFEGKRFMPSRLVDALLNLAIKALKDLLAKGS